MRTWLRGGEERVEDAAALLLLGELALGLGELRERRGSRPHCAALLAQLRLQGVRLCLLLRALLLGLPQRARLLRNARLLLLELTSALRKLVKRPAKRPPAPPARPPAASGARTRPRPPGGATAACSAPAASLGCFLPAPRAALAAGGARTTFYGIPEKTSISDRCSLSWLISALNLVSSSASSSSACSFFLCISTTSFSSRSSRADSSCSES